MYFNAVRAHREKAGRIFAEIDYDLLGVKGTIY
jgi:hypothetical protein